MLLTPTKNGRIMSRGVNCIPPHSEPRLRRVNLVQYYEDSQSHAVNMLNLILNLMNGCPDRFLSLKEYMRKI
jgi:hypothetical protein